MLIDQLNKVVHITCTYMNNIIGNFALVKETPQSGSRSNFNLTKAKITINKNEIQINQ